MTMDGQTPPNLLFVFPDQFRCQAMGFTGQDPVITPNLDRFASEGRVAPNATATCPLCSPYRAMLMTGKYPWSNGVVTNCNSWANRWNVFLRESERCFSDVLHDCGYSAGYIGKWHLDPPVAPPAESWQTAVWDAYTPPGPRRHGFDFWHSYGCMNEHLHPYYWEGDATEDEKTVFGTWSPEHEADVAMDYIRDRSGRCRAPDKPFALFVAMNPPHSPYDAVPRRYVDMYAGKTPEDLLNRPNVSLDGQGAQAAVHVKNYFAAVTGIDEQFGRILACLEEEGLADNTIVVFTADHGDMMGSQGRMSKNVWYEESFLVPFIIRWPGRIRPGVDGLHLGAPDVMPSLLGLMGLRAEVPTAVEGSDYSAVLLGQDAVTPSSAFYLDIADPQRPAAGRRGVRTDHYTFVVDRSQDKQDYILHDNMEDPYQLANIAADNPALIEELRAELSDWLERTRDPWREGAAGAE